MDINVQTSSTGSYTRVYIVPNIPTNDYDLTTVVNAAIRAGLDALFAQGRGPQDILFSNLVVQDLQQFAQVNSVYKTYFQVSPPSRSCVQMDLTAPLSIEFTACSGAPKASMHVQSISKWAPANIGPYSQATELRPLLWLSGMIALDPPTMVLVSPEDPVQQTERAFQSVRHVLQAKSCDTQDIVCTLLYYHHSLSNDTVQTITERWLELCNTVDTTKTTAAPASKTKNLFGPDTDSDDDDDDTINHKNDDDDDDDDRVILSQCVLPIPTARIPRDGLVEFECIACYQNRQRPQLPSKEMVLFQGTDNTGNGHVQGSMGYVNGPDIVTLCQGLRGAMHRGEMTAESLLSLRIYAARETINSVGWDALVAELHAVTRADLVIALYPTPVGTASTLTALWTAISELGGIDY